MLSSVEFHPQCVQNPPVAGCASRQDVSLWRPCHHLSHAVVHDGSEWFRQRQGVGDDAGDEAWADDPEEWDATAGEPKGHFVEHLAVDARHAAEAHVQHGARRVRVQPRNAAAVRRVQAVLLRRAEQPVHRPDGERRDPRQVAPDVPQHRLLDGAEGVDHDAHRGRPHGVVDAGDELAHPLRVAAVDADQVAPAQRLDRRQHLVAALLCSQESDAMSAAARIAMNTISYRKQLAFDREVAGVAEARVAEHAVERGGVVGAERERGDADLRRGGERRVPVPLPVDHRARHLAPPPDPHHPPERLAERRLAGGVERQHLLDQVGAGSVTASGRSSCMGGAWRRYKKGKRAGKRHGGRGFRVN